MSCLLSLSMHLHNHKLIFSNNGVQVLKHRQRSPTLLQVQLEIAISYDQLVTLKTPVFTEHFCIEDEQVCNHMSDA